MAQQTSAPDATERGDSRHSRGESAGDPSQPSVPPGWVPLERLLTVVVLNPAQGSLVGSRILIGTRATDPDDGAPPDDDVLWEVALAPSGDVQVARATASRGARVDHLLDLLARNARQLPAHPTPEQLGLLRVLEEVAADRQAGASDRARRLECALTGALGPAAPERLTRDLVALVGAFALVAPSTTAPAGAVVTLPRPESHRSAVARPRAVGTRPARTRTRRVVPLVLLAAVVAGSGYVVLRNPDGGEVGAVAPDTAPAAPGTSSPAGSSGRAPSRPRPEAATLADRRSGPVTSVAVERTAACTPGAACLVTTTVRFDPAPTSRAVVWKVGTARWCGSGITWSAPITVTAQPGWTSVYATTSVQVPRGRSLALVAVTSAPARAQSPPVPAAGATLACSPGHAQR